MREDSGIAGIEGGPMRRMPADDLGEARGFFVVERAAEEGPFGSEMMEDSVSIRSARRRARG